MVKFNKDLLPEQIPKRQFGDKTELVTISYLCNPGNACKLEDKVIHFRILSCTLGTPTTMAKLSSFASTKKQRTSYRISAYNRCFLVADLLNPPNCAMILTRTLDETSTLLRLNMGDVFVGSDFYFHEPNLCDQFMEPKIPILSINGPFIPLKYSDSAFPNKEAKMAYPTRPGETNYFSLIGKNIQLFRASFTTDTSCTGIQCDRQKSKGECTCTHTTNSTSYVYCFDVKFEVPRQIDTEDGNITVPKFRSLRTTKLFFQDFEEHASLLTREDNIDNLQSYRKQINEMVNYINGHGGWNIVGWFKLGQTSDAAFDNGEKVDNYDLTIHLSYLMPTKLNEVRTEPAFTQYLIKNTVPSPSNSTNNSVISIV